MRKIINDDVDALTRKYQAVFQIINRLMLGKASGMSLTKLNTSLRFPCLGLNIDSVIRKLLKIHKSDSVCIYLILAVGPDAENILHNKT